MQPRIDKPSILSGNQGEPNVQQLLMTRRLAIALLAFLAMLAGREAARAQINETGDLSIELVDPKVLRVCADPHNLPFSNEKSEGFENKLAELFAAKLNKKLDYMFFPQATGFVRMTLGAHRCDVIMGFPQGDDLVQGTNPYYRTAYALVAKPGSGLDDVTALEDERLKGKHIGIVAGTPPATNMAVNGLMMNAKSYQLMVDTRINSSAEAMIADLNSGKIDAGILWGTDGRLLRQAGEPAAARDAAGEGENRAATGVPHRHGRARRRPELEAAAEPNDRGEPACHQQDPARLRRAAARRERPADRGRDGHEGAMRRALAGLMLAALTSTAAAQERPPEPDGYRVEDYRAPVPATLAGARVLTTTEAEAIWRTKAGVFIDVMPRAPKPANLPQGTVWRDRARLNIPGSVWLPDTGYGKLAAVTEDYLRGGLERTTAGNKAALVVVYCQADCWMSWNAAKRILTYGYANVAWYPEGTDGWERAGLGLTEAQPEPR